MILPISSILSGLGVAILVGRRNFSISPPPPPTSVLTHRMSHLTLTKSKTSRISRPQTKSPIKKTPSFDLKARRIISPSEKPESQKRETTAQKLEVTHPHIPAGTPYEAMINIDPSLLISDVLAGANYLIGIQFPPFPERGLGRDRTADLYNARKVPL